MKKNRGFVYLMKPVGHNVYKIGETINVEKRIEIYQRKFDFKLEYVDYVQVDNDTQYLIEHRLHLEFYRYHLGGDWFVLPDDLIDQFDFIVRRVEEQVMLGR